MTIPSKHPTPRMHMLPKDPAHSLLKDDFVSKPKVYRPNCYICIDMEFARMGLPLCNLCCSCAVMGKEGHIAADGGSCDDCGHALCLDCYNLPPQKDQICSCNSPCCEVDVEVGVITCGTQHCPSHGGKQNEVQ